MTVVTGVPLALVPGALELDLGGVGRRSVSLNRIRAVAAGAVEDGGVGGPNLVLDLFVDLADGGRGRRAMIRCETRRFDPRALMPAEPESQDAFVSLAGSILMGSGAAWLVGEGPSRLRSYATLDAYEREVRVAVQRV